MPQTTKSFSFVSGVTASTVTPPPLTWAFAPMSAVFVTSSTFSPTPAPIDVSDLRSTAAPSAKAFAVVRFSALTLTAFVAVTWMPGAIEAVFVVVTQLTLTAAAMPTPPLSLSPVSLPELVLAVSVESDAFGSEPLVLPSVFGLFVTWSLDCWSAFWFLPPSSSAPFVLACAFAERRRLRRRAHGQGLGGEVARERRRSSSP